MQRDSWVCGGDYEGVSVSSSHVFCVVLMEDGEQVQDCSAPAEQGMAVGGVTCFELGSVDAVTEHN